MKARVFAPFYTLNAWAGLVVSRRLLVASGVFKRQFDALKKLTTHPTQEADK